MDVVSSLLSAFGLSTAAGLNAYIPLLVVGLTARFTDFITLGKPYDLLEHPAVLIVLGVLALADFIGDKVPAVDHALHLAGLVINPVAGAIAFMASSSATGSVDPALAAICGLILAGTAHGVRTAARPVATATTGGIANPVVSLAEDGTSLVVSLLAVVLPVLAFLLVLVLAVGLFFLLRRLFRRRDRVRPARVR